MGKKKLQRLKNWRLSKEDFNGGLEINGRLIRSEVGNKRMIGGLLLQVNVEEVAVFEDLSSGK